MGQFRIDESAKPYTHLNFKNDPNEFQFAIISDRAHAGSYHSTSGRTSFLPTTVRACAQVLRRV